MEGLVEVEHNDNEKHKGLTKMDLKALKRADMIAFHLSEIEAIKEIHNDPFETEKRYSIPVEYKTDGQLPTVKTAGFLGDIFCEIHFSCGYANGTGDEWWDGEVRKELGGDM